MIPSTKGSSSIDNWLEESAVRGLIACWLYPMVFIQNFRLLIPIHFDVNGQPNNYSIRANIWGIPVITTFIYVVLGLVNKLPQGGPLLNLSAHGPKVYALTMRMLRILKTEITIQLATIILLIIQIVLHKLTQMPGIMLFLFLATIFRTLAIYFWLVWRHSKKTINIFSLI